MATINSNYNIETNRGDRLSLDFKFKRKSTGEFLVFQVDDVVRFKIMKKNNCDDIVLQEDIKFQEAGETITLDIPSEKMKIGEIIYKPVDYWYELELYPDTPSSITLLGYTKASGPRILTLTPEGGDKR